MGLLALVMAGSFGVLLSASRKTTEPDMREEMVRAMDAASEMQKEIAMLSGDFKTKIEDFRITDPDFRHSWNLGCATPAGNDLSCLLPVICGYVPGREDNKSSFSYQLEDRNEWPTWGSSSGWEGAGNQQMNAWGRDNTNYNSEGYSPMKLFTFTIACEGYEL